MHFFLFLFFYLQKYVFCFYFIFLKGELCLSCWFSQTDVFRKFSHYLNRDYQCKLHTNSIHFQFLLLLQKVGYII